MATEAKRKEAKVILGIAEESTVAEAVAAHRRLAFEIHPDREPDPLLRPAAEERLKAINAARDVLTEPVVPSAIRPSGATSWTAPRAASAEGSHEEPLPEKDVPKWVVWAVVTGLTVLILGMFFYGRFRGSLEPDRSIFHMARDPFSLRATEGTETMTRDEAIFRREMPSSPPGSIPASF